CLPWHDRSACPQADYTDSPAASARWGRRRRELPKRIAATHARIGGVANGAERATWSVGLRRNRRRACDAVRGPATESAAGPRRNPCRACGGTRGRPATVSVVRLGAHLARLVCAHSNISPVS